jgi:8-oxo-dGTP pyrophosphatase MutT (NUDIX family)
MISQFKKELNQLKNKSYIDKKIFSRFIRRMDGNIGLTREENETSHFCSFFIPVHLATKSIFLGHHIKGNDWMPPGGHIDKGETPVESVKREFYEELKHKLTNEKVKLFDISVININNPLHNCKKHYDFWYPVFTDRLDFDYSKREFYKARWVKTKSAHKLVCREEYKTVIQKLSCGRIDMDF